MKKILLIDNTFDPPHGSPEIRRQLETYGKEVGGVEVTAVRGPEGAIPQDLSRFDGVVLSGSKTRINETAPWIELEMAAIRELRERAIPTLGICYGEQLIARTFGGEPSIGVAKRSEHGWVELKIEADSPILAGLPKKFHSFEYHNDEVRSLPEGFRLTASSERCPIQAYDVVGVPMWGLQFHPERNLEEGNRGLDRRLAENPEFPALNRERSEELYDAGVAAVIFRNFLRIVAGAR